MKKYITALLVFILFTTSMVGQEKKNDTYKFLNAKEINGSSKYVEAFKTADMTKFRFQNKRNTIIFENGLKVELFSADELTQKGYQVDSRKLLISEPTHKAFYTFALSPDGKTILQKFTKTKIK